MTAENDDTTENDETDANGSGTAGTAAAAEGAAAAEAAVDAAEAARRIAAWPRALLDVLAADPRVVGVVDVTRAESPSGVVGADGADGVPLLGVVTTWDGLAPLTEELPRLGALALGEGPAAEFVDTDSPRAGPGARWTGMTASLRRVEIALVRIGDLKPSAGGEMAVVVLDRKGVIDQWVRWSRGRDRSRDEPVATQEREAARHARIRLAVKEAVRDFERTPIGAVRVGPGGTYAPLRPIFARGLRETRVRLAQDVPVEAALAARIDAALASAPHAGTGYRVVPGPEQSPGDTLEAFLRVADGEGFLGDRVLFDAAAKRLADLSRRAPEFDEGFVLPTFDAVEARWRFGDGIGGCKTPLVPGVYVGVGVTPADHLEFWAAPFVREPMCSVACVADAGTRVVVERTAGKDAFFGALHGEVDRAWDELPEFVRTARRAGRTSAGDAEAALRPLHLPKTYREAAKAVLGATAAPPAPPAPPAPSAPSAPSRLQVALALARAGSGEEPLNARKFGLAAGRLIALTPPGADDGCETAM